jgi:predicted dienelactone hydrolase
VTVAGPTEPPARPSPVAATVLTPGPPVSPPPPSAIPAAVDGSDAAAADRRRPGATGAVGRVHLDLLDEARGRPLPTTVHYPAAPGPGGQGAVPAPGPFRLVVMAHGFGLAGEDYAVLLDAVATRGYIVAAPDFPGTSTSGPGDRRDLVNQPADVAAVADRVVETGGAGGLPAVADAGRYAVAGHSDGGLTAAALAYNERYRDPRVAAAVVLSGGMAVFPGEWAVPDPPPLLAVHGTADATNPLGASQRLVASLPAGVARSLVLVEGGGHADPFMTTVDVGTALGTVVADFLDLHLGAPAETGAAERFRRDASAPPLTLAVDAG